MSKSDLVDIFEAIISAGEPGRWTTFFTRFFYIFLLVTLVDITAGPLINKALHLNHGFIRVLIVLSYVLPLIINALIFIWSRFPDLKLRFSRKTNIVFAYNLNGINEEKFLKKYRILVEQVRNEIDSLEMGRKVCITQAPSDIRFKDKLAAEAKVLLGLEGSVLLIWGDVVEDHGKTRFRTLFSYEFGYPEGYVADQAKDAMSTLVSGIMRQGLFCAFKMDTAGFKSQITPTVFFILAVATATLRLFEKSKQFILTFNSCYHDADLMRKQELGPAYVKCKDLLKNIYMEERPSLTISSKEYDLNKSLELNYKILELDSDCYEALISIAYTLFRKGNITEAEKFNEKATKVAPKKSYMHKFNNAFFALRKQRYSEALAEYESIPDEINTTITDISSFLNEQFNLLRDSSFLFADGYVSMRWGDQKIGKKSLKKFIKITNSNTRFEPLLKSARELLDLS